MSPFDVKSIRAKAKKDYEKAWLETSKLLKRKGRILKWGKTIGRRHPIIDLVWRIRQILLSYGFEEVINPTIVDEADVYKEYGPEAPVILDRCFYLAGLPRPDIGLSRKKIGQIKYVVPTFTAEHVKTLQRIFREYKEGGIEGDNFVEEIVSRLGVEPEKATEIVGLFPELQELKPIPMKLTLRSHMTALWFPVLASLQGKKSLPVKLFSIGPKYRREQKLDAFHLYESLIASLIVMAEDLSLEDGQELTRLILAELGFEDVSFQVKKATSKYYAPGMEMEAFVKFRKEWIEVGDIGLYSPVSLARYDIRFPVFNAGLGVERIAMLIEGVADIRKLTFPQLYAEVELDDLQLAKMIRIKAKPSTRYGNQVLNAIIETALKNADKPSPCEFLAFKGNILGRMVEVFVYEPDVGTKLIGPAAFNNIYVNNGNILGIPPKGLEHVPLVLETREKGISTGIRYLDAVAALATAKIEEMVRKMEPKELNVRVKMAKLPSDVNVEVDDLALRYITSKKKVVDVRGPVFVGVKAKIIR